MTSIVALSDIRGNGSALRAVLQDLQTLDDYKICFLGGVLGDGPDPVKCMETVESFDYRIPNLYDTLIFNPKIKAVGSDRFMRIFDWSVEQIRLNKIKDSIRLWQSQVKVEHEILCVSHQKYSYEGAAADTWLPQNRLHRLLVEAQASILLSDFSCAPFLFFEGDVAGINDQKVNSKYTFEGRRSLICPGSVGGLWNIGQAQYAIITKDSVEFRQVQYDPEPLLEELFKLKLISEEDLQILKDKAIRKRQYWKD